MARRSDVADRGLAAAGLGRLEEAAARLPVLAAARERLAAARPLAGFRVSLRAHVRPEAGTLALALRDGGAEVLLCGAGAGTTEDDVAAALVEQHELPVFAVRGADADRLHGHLEAAVDHKPHLVLDDGAELIGLLHTARREQLGATLAGAEASPLGLLRMRALAEDGALGFPVLAVGESAVVGVAIDRPGAGRAAADEAAARSGGSLRGSRVAVVGYGAAGAAAAARATELGAAVVVAEERPLAALAASLDGFAVGSPRETLVGADAVLVTREDTLPQEAGRLREGAMVVAVSPAALDVVLALEALAAAALVRQAVALERAVCPVPAELDEELARLALAVRGDDT